MNHVRRLIVIVEDDASMRRALQRLLNLLDYDTLAFETAESFRKARYSRTPHCLLIGVQLPDASGPQLYARLVHNRPPVVFITADIGQMGYYALSHERLIKPFGADDLVDAISRAVDRSS